MNDKHITLKITETAKGNQFVDSEIHGGVAVAGRDTLFLRTKIFNVYKKYQKISIFGLLRDMDPKICIPTLYD